MMDPVIGGALISAGAGLAGQAYNSFSNKGMDAHEAAKHQRQMMQSQIQWRVADAKKAGISPLYALGAPTMSGTFGIGDSGGGNMGQALAEMGADVGRAVAAKQTDLERAVQALTLEKAGLENDYLREQIASIRNRTVRESAPPLPGLVPEKVVSPERTGGLNAGVGYPTNPYVSDMNSFTNRYGESEIFEMLGGLGVGAADIIWNLIRAKNSVRPDSGGTAARRAAILRRGSRY